MKCVTSHGSHYNLILRSKRKLEKKGQENNNWTTTGIKEVFSGVLDIKREERGTGIGKGMAKAQAAEVLPSNHSHNNQSWSTRPRDKNGRFMSSGAVTAATTAASNTTTAVAITTTPIIATAKPPSSSSWHNNKLRDSRGRFTANRTAWLKPY